MTDSTNDIVVTRLINHLDRTTDPEQISALTQEFARHKPPASPKLDGDFISPEQQVIAKIVAQEDTFKALHDLGNLADLGGASPEDAMRNRHSLSVPAAQAWSALLQTLPTNDDKIGVAIETMSLSKSPVMKEVAASALLHSLTHAKTISPLEKFGIKLVQDFSAKTGNDLLTMQLRDFHHQRVRTLIEENAARSGPALIRT